MDCNQGRWRRRSWPSQRAVHRLVLAALVLSPCGADLATSPAVAQTTDVCAPIAQIAAKAAQLESLAGRPVTGDSWAGAIQVPGFGRCVVKRRTQVTYECENAYPTSAAAMAGARAVGQRVARCPAVSVFDNSLGKPVPAEGLLVEQLLAGSTGDAIVSVRAEASRSLVNGKLEEQPLAVLQIIGPAAAAPPAAPKPDASLSALTDLNTFSPDAQAFCKDIKAIYDDIPNGLATLIGAERKVGAGRFNAKLTPSGMERCYIAAYADGRKYYSCTALSDSPKTAVVAAAAKVVDLMKTCRPGLVVRARIDSEGDASIDLTDPTAPAVQGRVWTLHIDEQQWDVMLNIKQAG
jgi:hypothetical protein